MTYELAEQLKENGYPQNWKTASAFYDANGELNTIGYVNQLSEWKDNPDGSGYHTASTSGCGCCSDGIGQSVNEYVLAPTLEELIEACLDSKIAKYDHTNFMLFTLRRGSKIIWEAQIDIIPDKMQGNTPSEAVANLYLALNK